MDDEQQPESANDGGEVTALKRSKAKAPKSFLYKVQTYRQWCELICGFMQRKGLPARLHTEMTGTVEYCCVINEDLENAKG